MPFHSAVHSDVEASAGAGPPEAGSQQALNRYLSHRQQTMRSMTTRTREERYLSTRVFQLAASAVLIAFALLMLRVTSGAHGSPTPRLSPKPSPNHAACSLPQACRLRWRSRGLSLERLFL
mmetsp:Transcript_39293/g.123024  ORF Transcript_39293/g.123024 Transcript_39293/m.123024 type:complete len:121 (+) Transcript_39293:165-527(+)